MTPVDMIALPQISAVTVDASGSQVLVARSVADWEADKRVHQYWRFDLTGRALHHLPALDGADTAIFSPDGRFLAIDMPPEGSRSDEVFLAEADGTGLRRLTRHPTSIRDIAWSPDGAWIYFLATDTYSEAEKARRERLALIDPYFETLRHRHLWRVDPRDRARPNE